MGTRLYVGNIAFDVTSKEVEDLFAQSGDVASVRIISDRSTGQPRGFAFVEMHTNKEAQTAISRLNGVEFKGRTLKVNEARPPAGRQGWNRGGRGPR